MKALIIGNLSNQVIPWLRSKYDPEIRTIVIPEFDTDAFDDHIGTTDFVVFADTREITQAGYFTTTLSGTIVSNADLDLWEQRIIINLARRKPMFGIYRGLELLVWTLEESGGLKYLPESHNQCGLHTVRWEDGKYYGVYCNHYLIPVTLSRNSQRYKVMCEAYPQITLSDCIEVEAITYPKYSSAGVIWNPWDINNSCASLDLTTKMFLYFAKMAGLSSGS